MRNKNPHSFRFSPEAEAALEVEVQRTGKRKVGVIEDLLLWKRQFGDEAEAAVQFLAQKHKLPPRKILEVAVLKVAGIGGDLPFDHPLAA